MRRTPRNRERGMALLLALVAAVAFAGIATGMITSSLATSREHASVAARAQRLYLAEAAVSYAFLDIEAGGDGCLGSVQSPIALGSGTYFTNTVIDADETVWITAVGTVNGDSRAVQAMYREKMGVFHHAMFSGNSSGDPTYVMRLAGSGDEADVIDGEVFSGGDVIIEGDAEVTGTIRAAGEITGGSGQEGVSQPIPDLQEMNYEVNHDIDVKQQFTDYASNVWLGWGKTAWQVPEDHESHIFRMNPSDRVDLTAATAKDDFFLEDPYEDFVDDPAITEEAASDITLSGVDGAPGPNGNEKVYYIDGNLWLHSHQSFSFEIVSKVATGVQVTFVVKGNIYFSDNLYLRQSQKDGIAFVALKDESVADSGNIYFGDPNYGTLLRMDAFMYAENNFYDYNLDEEGSTTVNVNGTMSAGNQVAINRDYDDHHTSLALTFDDRIKDGTLVMPGIPDLGGDSSGPKHTEVASIEISVKDALGN